MLSRKWLAAIGTVLTVLLARSAGARHSPVRPAPPPGAVNEFRYLHGSLVCVAGDGSVDAKAITPCLHIGAIRFQQTAANVGEILGNPWQIAALDDGATMNVYPLRGDVDASPYLAVRFRAGEVDAIQLSGEQTPDDYGFSGLHLGDPAERLPEVLGPAGASEKLGDTGVTLLSWRTVPVSVEVRDRRIVSIKIWRVHS